MKRFVLILALACLTTTAYAGEILIKVNTHNSAIERWTAEDFANAKPLPLPRIKELKAVPQEAPSGDFLKETFGSEAEEPTLPDEAAYALGRTLFEVKPAAMTGPEETPDSEATEVPLKNYGPFGLDYTSSRLIPSSAAETFPYRAVGKFYFTDSVGDRFVCSAAVITRRLVLTAGHCVHGGPVEGWHDDFLFIPAYYNGDAPFGEWDYSTAFVDSTWANSGEVPNAADWALVEMQDQGGNRISEVTGKLGFVINLTADNHLHMLGYPVNLDNGEEMHQVTSGDYFFYLDNTVMYGSDMSGGSSGGPWVQNFNRKSQGQGGGFNRARAAVVGVISYGTDSPSDRIQGASIFNRDFKVLRQEACFNQDGNC
ncbi:MAG: trypsin-like serine protease [bacterium]|nr:trypsin-like serine protease [bacterium]